mgnify:CR=1 FL=1
MLGVTALFPGRLVALLRRDRGGRLHLLPRRREPRPRQGFTFNRGAPPIGECSSSLTYQLLLVPFALLARSDPVVEAARHRARRARALAPPLIARRLTDDPLFAALPPLILAVSIPFYHWSQRGLETPLYVCLLLAAVGCAFHPRWRERWYWPAFALVCTRPEGPLLALVLLCFAPAEAPRARASRGLLVLAALCGALLCAAPSLLHDLVPNPFYTKLRSSTESGLPRCGPSRGSGILWVLVPGALAALAGELVAGRGARRDHGGLRHGLGRARRGLEALQPPPRRPCRSSRAPRGVHGAPRALPPAARVVAAVYFAGASAWIVVCAPAVRPDSSGGETWPNPPLHRGPATGRAPLDWRDAHAPSSDRIDDNLQATAGKFLARLNSPRDIAGPSTTRWARTPWYAGLTRPSSTWMGLVNREVGVSLFLERKKLERARPLPHGVAGAAREAGRPDERRDLGLDGVTDSFPRARAHPDPDPPGVAPEQGRRAVAPLPGPARSARCGATASASPSTGAVLVLERKGARRERRPIVRPEGCTVVESPKGRFTAFRSRGAPRGAARFRNRGGRLRRERRRRERALEGRRRSDRAQGIQRIPGCASFAGRCGRGTPASSSGRSGSGPARLALDRAQGRELLRRARVASPRSAAGSASRREWIEPTKSL